MRAYLITVSRPGCLPDGESAAYASLEGAVGALVDEIERTCETSGVDMDADADACAEGDGCRTETAALLAALRDRPWRLERGVSVAAHGYVHEAAPAPWPGRCAR